MSNTPNNAENIEDKKRLLFNFISLSALQGINMVLPIITLPYLVRVLGVEIYGLVNYVLSIIMYFNILVSFGFELSATREISIHRGNTNKTAQIFSTVMMIKTAIALFSLLILFILTISIDTMIEHALLYYATFGVVLGNVLFPSWFFQGMERMKYITYINIISRMIFTVLIFGFVQESSDYIYVPILNSLGAIIGGMISLWLVYSIFDITFVRPTKSMMFTQLKESYHYFLSRAANNGSRFYATTIIGIYFGNMYVGYYSMVEKLFYAFLSFGTVVSQTIYPYMSRTKNTLFYKKILFALTIVSIVLLLPIMYYNKILLQFVFNVNDEMLSKIFIIVFSGAIFGTISALLGYPLLAAYGHVKYANNSLIYASILYVIYITCVVAIEKNIYLLSLSLPIYMFLSFAFRVYYIKKEKMLHQY